MSYLNDRSHKKAILSLYQVGVPSKHAQNEDEKHLHSNNSTERNEMDELESFVCRIQPPPVISALNLEQKLGVQRKRHNNIYIYMWN